MTDYRPLERTFVIENRDDAATCAGFVRSLVPQAPGWRIHIEPNREERTPKQLKREWALMRYIAANAWLNGKQFSAPAWRAHYCGMFIGYEDTPFGDPIPLGTSTLNTKEHNDWFDRVMHDATATHGVDFAHWDERDK